MSNAKKNPDRKIIIDANDTIPDYLENKLIEGNGISIIKNSIYGYETLTISNSGNGDIILRDNQIPPHNWKLIVDNNGVLGTVDLGI